MPSHAIHAIPFHPMPSDAIRCNTIPCHPIPPMPSDVIPCHPMPPNAIRCNTMPSYFFCEVGPKLGGVLPNSSRSPENYIKQRESEFEIQKMSVDQVYKLLCALKTSKAAGHDKILQKLLKDAADILAHSLTAVFDLSVFETGIFSDDLKTAVVCSSHKLQTYFRAFCGSKNFREINF